MLALCESNEKQTRRMRIKLGPTTMTVKDLGWGAQPPFEVPGYKILAVGIYPYMYMQLQVPHARGVVEKEG